MPTQTTNYSLDKPLVNNATDQDLWGGYLNGDMDDIDGLLRVGITLSPSVQTTSFSVNASISIKYLYRCDATAATLSATLPAAASIGGATVYFKKTDITVNAITITANGSDKIDGAASISLSTQYAVVGLVSDGVSKWDIVTTPAAAVFTGDSGTGGTSGLVPAPAAGDAAANKFLKASGGWAAIGSAPLPISSSGIGQWTTIGGSINVDVTLPAGGTWSYFAIRFSSIGTWDGSQVAGVAAGGTTVMTISGGKTSYGFAWRIT